MGQVMTIGGGEITGPFGETTIFGPNREEFRTTISNSDSEMTFAYTPFETDFDVATRAEPMADGLLLTVEDPNGGNWSYDYDARGRLKKQNDADQASITSTRGAADVEPGEEDEIEEAYAVELKTREETTFSHELKEFKSGRAERKITAAGKTTTITTKPDLSETGTLPWDASFERTRRPGERHTLTTGLPARLGDLAADYKLKRPAPRDLLGAESFTQKTTWNGATSTTTGNGTTITSTTPGGRSVTTTTDSLGRPQTMQLPGLPAITIDYDQGRPTKVTQGGRSVSLGYTGAFVSSITDPLGRTVTVPREGDGRVDNQDVYGVEQFDYGYDANGNLTGTTSPQSGGYSESTSYTPVNLVESFNLPAGQTTISYNADREPTGGTSPHGALQFDGEGRLTDVGDIHYDYDDEDYVTGITSPDGSIAYEYDGKPVPTSVTWSGSVAGTVEIGRNERFQATSIGVQGGPSINITVDADGVVTQAGGLTIERDAATFIKSTTLGNTRDTYERNALGEPMRYTVTHDTVGELFSEEYTRDHGGRIQAKTVRIRNPSTNDLETYTVQYGYDSAGRLETVTYNDDAPIHYAYDANNNLIGAPAEAPTPTPGPQRLFLHAATSVVTPGATEGSWTDTSTAELASMGKDREGSPTATTVSAADCDASGAPRRILATTFVSPALTEAHAFTGNENLELVIGAAETGTHGALQPVATVWLMDGTTGDKRCTLVNDWRLTNSALPYPDAKGIESHSQIDTGTGSCATATAETDDRLIIELGYTCTNTSTAAIEATLSRGGTGPALTVATDPNDGTCGRPGYLQIEGGLQFLGTPEPSPCDPATTIPVSSRRLYAVTVNAENQATGAHLFDPQGIEHHYRYTYDTHGVLESKTEVDGDGQPISNTTVTYDYDVFGNLRHVTLADGREIEYRIDSINRRVGRVLKDAQGNTLSVRKYLYQSGLQPIAELDENGNVVTFFVYGERPNVPEYLVTESAINRIVTDELGSVRLVINAQTSEIVQRIGYDEHGNVLDDWVAPGQEPVPFGYAGGIYDPESGLVRLGARDYDPTTHRWTAQDAVGFVGGDANLHAYVGNDPINFIDPVGFGKIRTTVEGIKLTKRFWTHVIERHTRKQLKEYAGRTVFKEGNLDKLAKEFEKVVKSADRVDLQKNGRKLYQKEMGRVVGTDGETVVRVAVDPKTRKAVTAFAAKEIVVPGAALGVTLFGDNFVGHAADFLNPLSDIQDAVDLLGEPAAEAGRYWGRWSADE